MTPAQRQHLFSLIDEACTNKQIQSLLKQKRDDDKKIRVSGTSVQLIEHLKAAHDRGVIREEDLTKLLASGEENGRQHIFLYSVTTQAESRYRDMARVRDAMMRHLGVSENQVPRFVLEPSGRSLSDVRLQKVTDTVSNLVVKWYSGRLVERIVSEEKFERYGDQFIRREVKIEKVRLVSVARLLPRGLLEIRVPTGQRESRKICLDELDEIWTIIGDVIPRHHFLPLSLTKPMKWLVKNVGKKGPKYRLSQAKAADGDARADFMPAMEGQDLFSFLRHRDAMASYEEFAGLDVYWESPSEGADGGDEIRCQMAMYHTHGFRIGSKRAAEEIDFVVNRLWDLT